MKIIVVPSVHVMMLTFHLPYEGYSGTRCTCDDINLSVTPMKVVVVSGCTCDDVNLSVTL